MPKVGIEPTLPKERDFESRASASSATSAYGKYSQTLVGGQVFLSFIEGGSAFYIRCVWGL
jgi:hypothetical protein